MIINEPLGVFSSFNNSGQKVKMRRVREKQIKSSIFENQNMKSLTSWNQIWGKHKMFRRANFKY